MKDESVKYQISFTIIYTANFSLIANKELSKQQNTLSIRKGDLSDQIFKQNFGTLNFLEFIENVANILQ